MKALKHLRMPLTVIAVLAAAVFGAVGCMCLMPGSPSTVITRELTPEEAAVGKALRAHVEFLASSPRAPAWPEHQQAVVEYIEAELRKSGYQPIRQPVEVEAGSTMGESYEAATYYNVIVRIPGSTKTDEVVVLGAHWDTRGPTPGADDNATGVAALLELAKWLKGKQPERSLELAFWANEEPPFFRTEGMGSLVHAKQLFAAGTNVVWMVSLEMLGYYDPEPGSQKYPPVLSAFYPDHGGFAAFVGSMWHRDAVTKPVEVMREEADFPMYGFAGPERMTGIGFSDHWSFWQVGYPGVMVTDTSFFRTPHYHQLTDTPDTLDWNRFSRLVVALRPLVAHYAGL